MKALFLSIFALLFSFTSLYSQGYQQLLDNKTKALLHEELSGELAKEHVIQITRSSRVQGSREYRDAAQYVLKELRRFGYSEEDAWIESFKSDGKVHYQTWQSPSGWDIDSGELRMLEPYNEMIARYPDIAMSVVTYSNPGNESGELVFVGSGTSDSDYAGKDVRGKVVLATGYGGSVHRLAVLKYGAKFVVCYLDDYRSMEFPDMLAYTGMWPRSKELEDVTFGFNLTKNQGEKLKKILASGKTVIVNGKVEGIGLEPYFMDTPVAFIRGSEKPEEVLIYSAHLDHPKESANDNASGSAAMLDMARGMKKLIDSGKIPRPKRSIQFLWIPEFYGTQAYLDKHDEMMGPHYGGKYLANINMDMVGENQELLHSQATFSSTPASIPSVLNVVVENMVQMVSKMNIRTPRGSLSTFNWQVTPYSGGSDHNQFIANKIPGMMFGHSPDDTHHTSEDTPDKVDPVELEREEVIAAATMLYLANLDSDQARSVGYLAAGKASQRLILAADQAIALGKSNEAKNSIPDVVAEAHNIFEMEKIIADKTVESLMNFNGESADVVKDLKSMLNSQYKVLKKNIERAVGKNKEFSFKTDSRIPKRMTRGVIDGTYLTENLKGADLEWYNSSLNKIRGDRSFELPNFIDGVNTVTDIRNALSAEYGVVSMKTVARYVEMLVNIGLAEWSK